MTTSRTVLDILAELAALGAQHWIVCGETWASTIRLDFIRDGDPRRELIVPPDVVDLFEWWRADCALQEAPA